MSVGADTRSVWWFSKPVRRCLQVATDAVFTDPKRLGRFSDGGFFRDAQQDKSKYKNHDLQEGLSDR